VKLLAINSETMGRGDDELGRQLLASLLRKLWAAPNRPHAMVFYNSGVKLLAEGSGVLEALVGLSEAGVDLVACGTCVSFFGLRESLRVGRVSDMQEISALMVRADSAITV
jgi:selenium metabolism protein YedF